MYFVRKRTFYFWCGCGRIVGMDKGALFKMAATYLGEAGCVGGSPLEGALEDCVQQAVALALDYTHWDFALERAELPVVKGVVELPPDCLEVRVVEGVQRWRKRGRFLVLQDVLADVLAGVVLWYKSNKLAAGVVLPDAEPFFCEGVALLLAAKAAMRVTSSFNLAGELEKRAYGALYRAKLKEARQGDSNDQLPSFDGVWESI